MGATRGPIGLTSRHCQLFTPQCELLIDLSAPPATAPLRFATVTGFQRLADLRASADRRVEVLRSRGIRTRMKKMLPRLNRRLPKEIQGVEATWWEPWWEYPIRIRYLRQSLGHDQRERMEWDSLEGHTKPTSFGNAFGLFARGQGRNTRTRTVPRSEQPVFMDSRFAGRSRAPE
jgi:hypothetical protein